MYELSNILDLKRNGKNYSDLAKNLENLRQKSVVIYDEEKEINHSDRLATAVKILGKRSD